MKPALLLCVLALTLAACGAAPRDSAKQFTGDEVIDTKSFGFGGLPPEIATKVQPQSNNHVSRSLNLKIQNP